MRVGPILLWILLHLGALALSAAALPLWAHHPLPREALAVHVMLAVEIAGSAVVWPLLFPNRPTSIVIVLLVWPFMQLAGVLAVTPQHQLLLASTYVSLWLVGLAALNGALHSPTAMRAARALSSAYVLGAVVLLYLQSEASAAGTLAMANFGPILGAFAIVDDKSRVLIPWLGAAVPLLLWLALTLKNRQVRIATARADVV